MKWEITGADRKTGKDSTIIIEAENEESAMRRGNRAGMMISDCRPLDPNDSVCSSGNQILEYQNPNPQPPPMPSPIPMANPVQPIIQQIIVETPQPRWSPGVAALLSFLIPGAGQMYKGQIINGIAWLLLVIVGYFMCFIPGIILHLCCIGGAASGNPYQRQHLIQ